ncbi:hypothetical protein ARMSODRAFT_116494 [Armillaria solidipes]|uniref:Uncharacterized protein n=1 Tax=Armillaria solidipes TaxID=1076256 RepID=A0A2H3BI36_9AGAR|nr:hypothetical protein ARMSODRAFT_116494 [Armillaria solidipes]
MTSFRPLYRCPYPYWTSSGACHNILLLRTCMLGSSLERESALVRGRNTNVLLLRVSRERDPYHWHSEERGFTRITALLDNELRSKSQMFVP